MEVNHAGIGTARNQFTDSKASPDSVLSYLERGGFPAYLKTGEPEILRQLVRDIVNRDVAVRHGIKDTRPLETLLSFLLANAGSRVTPSRLTGALRVNAPSTVLAWFDHFETTYIVERLERFSDSAKARSLAPKKVYAVDTALARIASPSRIPDLGHALENAVWREVRRRSARRFYWADDTSECDFVWDDETGAFDAAQVCLELTPGNRERELTGLLGGHAAAGCARGDDYHAPSVRLHARRRPRDPRGPRARVAFAADSGAIVQIGS